jgi:hypothetical protein
MPMKVENGLTDRKNIENRLQSIKKGLHSIHECCIRHKKVHSRWMVSSLGHLTDNLSTLRFLALADLLWTKGPET